MNLNSVREQIEANERANLNRFAARSGESKGRPNPEEPDPVRTCFMRDRDRILHSKPFRRLKHKTQVFIAPEGDHYRTRLTHTLEVAQIARTLGRALRLNEDLIEAIALGHDVGHPPFGHAGEAALDEAVREHHARTGSGPSLFRHYEQSLHLLMERERLNLTEEVQAGIGGHSKGEGDLTAGDGQMGGSLEASVVRLSDRIAYMNHDLDDALRSGIIPKLPDAALQMGKTHSERIGRAVADIILHSMDQPELKMSDEVLAQMNELKDWLFAHVYYRYPVVLPEINKAKDLVRELFEYFVQPGHLPPGFEGPRGALDYVCGMTDRFAIAQFEALRVPMAFSLRTIQSGSFTGNIEPQTIV